MLDSLTTFFSSLPVETQFFVVAIVLIAALLHTSFNAKSASQGPTILTTTGIFATFLGIAMGLQRFDVHDIQSSVPQLLIGLKTAFWASVAGVGGALTLKGRDLLFGHKVTNIGKPTDDVSGADVLEGLRTITRALVGAEEASLLTQFKLARQDTNDRLDPLKNAQLEALAKLSDMSSKVLVEALRDVIRDFNAKITDEFGDNFKELNSAVGALLKWQDQYKQHVETITLQLAEVCSLQSRATSDYSEIVEKTGTFSKAAADLAALLSSINEEKKRFAELSEHMAGAFAAASGSIEVVETKLIGISNQLESAHSKMAEGLSRAAAEHSAAVKTSINTSYDAIVATQKEFHKNAEEISRKVQEQVKALDHALEQELEKALTSLGKQLTALSEKFVSDYMPLTEKLQLLVQASRRT